MEDLIIEATAGIVDYDDDEYMGVKKGDTYIKLDFFDGSEADYAAFVNNNITVYKSGAIDTTITRNTKFTDKLVEIYKIINGGKDDLVEFEVIDSLSNHNNSGAYVGGVDPARWDRVKEFIKNNKIELLTQSEREMEIEGYYGDEVINRRI